MTWFKVDDTLAAHPKARRAGLPAIGLWAVAGSWSSQQLEDGFVPGWFVESWPSGRKLANALVSAKLWTPAVKEGDKGWQFHQWDERQPSSDTVKAERRANAARQKVARSPELRDAIRRRDGDLCRYCGCEVDFRDKRSPHGGTYDHVIPDGPTDFENLAVTCRGCNARKGRRTPDEAGMELLPPGSKSDSSPTQIRTPTPDSDTAGVSAGPLKDGSGRDGSGSGRVGPGRAGAGRVGPGEPHDLDHEDEDTDSDDDLRESA